MPTQRLHGNLQVYPGLGLTIQPMPTQRLRGNLQVYHGPGLTIQPMSPPRLRPNRQAQVWRLLAWERPEWS